MRFSCAATGMILVVVGFAGPACSSTDGSAQDQATPADGGAGTAGNGGYAGASGSSGTSGAAGDAGSTGASGSSGASGAAGSGGTGAGTCDSPSLPVGWTPPAYVSAAHSTPVCTQHLAIDLLACELNASSPACSADTEHAACKACAWGTANDNPAPAVFDNRKQNLAGCIEVVGGDASCASSYAAYLACGNAACSNCSDDAYWTCLTASDSGVCKDRWDEALACMNPIWGKISPCFDGSWRERYYYLVDSICGYLPGSTVCAPYMPDPGLVPAYIPATGGHQNKCTSQQISELWTACLNTSSTAASCEDFGNANTACYDCVGHSSARNVDQYGPIVGYRIGASKHSTVVNTPGCIELMGDKECAAGTQAAVECEEAACAPSCDYTNQTEFDAYIKCLEDARKGVCGGLKTAADTCANALPQATKDACIGSTLQEGYTKVATLFCGP